MRVWPGLLLLAGGCETFFPLEVEPSVKPRGCSPAGMVVDTFDGSGPLMAPWTFPAVDNNSYQRASDALIIQTFNNGQIYGATLVPYLEMRGQRFSVTARHRSGTTTGRYGMVLDTQEPIGNSLFIGVEWSTDVNGNPVETLVAGHNDNIDGTLMTATLVEMPRVEPDHRFWAIEQDDEITRWLVSSDGLAFATLFETTGLVDWVTYMQPTLFADAIGGSEITFDDFGGAGPPLGAACPAGSLRETFDAPPTSDWQTVEQACTIAYDGELRAEMAAGDQSHTCAITTSTVYNLKDRSLTLDVREVAPADSSGEAFFAIETLSGTQSRFFSDGTTVTAFAGSERGFRPATTATHWRLSATSDDDLVFETSADGDTFEIIGNSGAGTVGRLDAVRIAIGFSTGDGDGTGAIARFGGLTSP